MKRQRGRGRKPSNPSNRSYESNGPDVKIRGNANQVYEKYLQYARDAQTSGDRIAAEAYFQHAEHYFRIIAANTPKDRMPQFQDDQDDHYDEKLSGHDADDKSSDDEDDDDDNVVGEVEGLQVVDGDAEAPEQIKSSVDEEKKPTSRYRGRRPPRGRSGGSSSSSSHGSSSKTEKTAEAVGDDAGLRAMMARSGAPEIATEPAAD